MERVQPVRADIRYRRGVIPAEVPESMNTPIKSDPHPFVPSTPQVVFMDPGFSRWSPGMTGLVALPGLLPFRRTRPYLALAPTVSSGVIRSEAMRLRCLRSTWKRKP